MTILGTVPDTIERKFIDATADDPFTLIPFNDEVLLVGSPYEKILDSIAQEKPDAILMSSMFTTEYFACNELARRIKEKFSTPIIVGGHQATLRPSWHLDENSIDYVVRGEGEKSVAPLIQFLDREKHIDEVPGLSYRTAQGTLVHNPLASPLADLDQDWDLETVLLDEGRPRYPLRLTTRNPELYLPPEEKQENNTGVLYASRGCAYACRYCNATERDGKKIRHMSLEHMTGLLQSFQSLGANTFHNESDTFGIHPLDREFLAKTASLGINLVNTNAFFLRYFFPKSTFSQKRAQLVKDAGLHTVTISIESFQEKYNNGKWRGVSPGQVKDAVEHMHGMGLKTELYMMYLFPGQTEEEFRRDRQLAEYVGSSADSITWRSLMLFPGTSYYAEALQKGLIDEEAYKQDIRRGWSFYKPNKRYNLSRIADPPNL